MLRISIPPEYQHLVPFFDFLESLPPGQRNLALLRALAGGIGHATQSPAAPAENERIARGIEALVNDW